MPQGGFGPLFDLEVPSKLPSIKILSGGSIPLPIMLVKVPITLGQLALLKIFTVTFYQLATVSAFMAGKRIIQSGSMLPRN